MLSTACQQRISDPLGIYSSLPWRFRPRGAADPTGMIDSEEAEAPRRRVAEGELSFNKLMIKGVCKGKNLRGETDEAFVA
mgnify:CR=1 FL=1